MPQNSRPSLALGDATRYNTLSQGVVKPHRRASGDATDIKFDRAYRDGVGDDKRREREREEDWDAVGSDE